ncbi:MAG: long-chain fatty acid--CoA ligase [Saprospiraceae bacterium]|nr:long-chain fatty acid--CoA ligase [Saprospiraceae bacterium]
MFDKRLFDYLLEQAQYYPLDKAFGRKVNGQWTYLSSKEMLQLANRASIGLLRMGLRPGDKVATVVYQTTPEWVALDYAMLQIGVINVPMYPTISSREYEYILQESEAKYCVVGDGDLCSKVLSAKEKLPGLLEVFTFEPQAGARLWTSFLAPADADFSELDIYRAQIKPDDMATIIYTSGTTGNPKGVMLSHRNIVYNVETVRAMAPIVAGDRVLSFLPVSHVYERVATYLYTFAGASVSYTNTDNLGGEDGDLRSIKPHFFTCVPRLLEKVYDRIYNKGLELKGPKRWLFFWALSLTDDWEFDKTYSGWKALQWKIAHKLIFSKWREALGGNVKGMTTGASACPTKILRSFNAAGIPVREVYGLSEVAPGLSINGFGPGEALLGTVGPALIGVDLRLEFGPDFRPGEGEILAKSPGLMLGYYKKPEQTAEMIREIDGERWLATGDVGTFVDGPGGKKFLKITDRKKELLKTSGGKYVAPTPIESMLKEHHLVEQAMVVGENMKFVSALIVPAEQGLRDWCHKHQIAWTTLAEMIRNPKVIHRYEMLLERVNPHFSHVDQLKKFALVAEPWEPTKTDGTEAELTPTLKMKRRVILEKCRKEIEEMYE